MSKTFKRGDYVEWNSEAGRVRGTVVKKVVSEVKVKGYSHHATKEEPQYFIKSDKTDHIAIHKGSALRLLRSQPQKKATKPAKDTGGKALRLELGLSPWVRQTVKTLPAVRGVLLPFAEF